MFIPKSIVQIKFGDKFTKEFYFQRYVNTLLPIQRSKSGSWAAFHPPALVLSWRYHEEAYPTKKKKKEVRSPSTVFERWGMIPDETIYANIQHVKSACRICDAIRADRSQNTVY